MILDLVRVKDRGAPDLTDPNGVKHARIWHCSYKSLEWVRTLSRLETLVVATVPDDNLDFLEGLSALTYLSVLHFPRVTSLGALATLSELRTVRLATSPGWDSSGRVTRVDSLAPLAALPHLRHLELFGVCDASKSLADLEASQSLATVRVSQYPAIEMDRFRTSTGWADSFAPRPPVEGWI